MHVLLAVLSIAVPVTRDQPIDVAGTPIARERLEHWQRVAAQGQPRTWRRARFRREAARLLVSEVWLRKEARARGVYAPRAQVERRMRAQVRASFTSQAAFRRFLRNTGQTRADIRAQVRSDLHASRIREQVTRGADTAQEHQALLDAFADEYTARWRGLTTCSPRYHVAAQCRDITRRGPAR